MVGNNTITVNKATMNKALEYYLNSIMLPGSKLEVTDVCETNTTGFFKVCVKPKEESSK